MKKRAFKISIRIRGVDTVFSEGMEPGEIASQEVSFDGDAPEGILEWRVYEEGQRLLKEEVQVLIHEIV